MPLLNVLELTITSFVDYVFDGHENDNIRWMNNDIAVVKIEEGFDFTRRIRGCDFVPKPICYNNQSQTLENPGSVVSIAGWGTTSRYNDVSIPSKRYLHLNCGETPSIHVYF